MPDRSITWSRVSDFVADTMGLHFPPERLPDLQRGLAAAAVDLGFDDAESCADQMLAAAPSRDDLRVLASHLTVGETYFFRDEALFDRLSTTVVPALVRAREHQHGDRRLRLWSAGCCTGEEAYSLAILLHRVIPDLARWYVSILATDINLRFLRTATTGVYGEWSFRNAPAGFKERWFRPTSGGKYALVPEVKRLVTFVPSNLVDDTFPALATDTNAMDLILCRNVLMYFTPVQARKVVARLHRTLVDGGILAVSPSEVSSELFDRFTALSYPGVTLYVKEGAKAASFPSSPSSASSADDVVASDTHEPAGQPLRVPPGAPAATAPSPHPHRSRDLSLQARTLANEGRLAEALDVCDRWIATDKVDAAGHYLRALVLLERGDFDGASDALQRAVYLKPDLATAHFTLGNLARGRGRADESARHFRNALDLLAGQRPDAILPETGGLTAGGLGEIIRELTALEQPA